MKKYLLFLLGFLCFLPILQLMAQETNTGLLNTNTTKKGKLSLGGYIDGYLGTTGNKSDVTLPYLVSSNRNNQFNINLSYLDLRFSSERFRARFVPAIGTYMQSNYANEPAVFKNIVEASTGILLNKKRSVWLDFGILGSPYTNESAISKDHLMYTRSFAAEYSPYYLTGAKLSFSLNNKWNAAIYLLNGWQQIKQQTKGLAIGTQVEYRPNKFNLFNWNTYIGNEASAFNPHFNTRFFTDFYWIHHFEGKLSISAGAYIGWQNIHRISSHKKTASWWQSNIAIRYKIRTRSSISTRIEFFSDPDQVMVTALNNNNSFSSASTGFTYNYTISKQWMFRTEYRYFFSDKLLFTNASENPSTNLSWLVTNLTFSF